MNTSNNFVKWPLKRVIGLLILFIGLFYFIYLPVSYDFDGTVFGSYLRYSLLKEDLSVAVQPHHPLYFPANYGIYKLLNLTTGYRVLEYFHLQLFSLLFGLLTLWVSYRILKSIWGELQGRLFFISWGIALVAFSYGVWYYSVEAEVHMAGLFFTALGMYLLFFKPHSEKSESLGRLSMSALCFAAAAGFHLTNGLIAVSILIIFLVERRPVSRIVRFFSVYLCFLLIGFVLLSLFSRVNLLEHFKNQLIGNDPMAGYTISYWSGGISPRAIWESLESVAHGFIIPGSPALSLTAVLIFLGLAGLVVRAAYKSGSRETYYRMAAWMLPYFVFFCFWDHRNTEFKLNVFLPFVLLVILSSAHVYSVMNRRKQMLWGSLFLLFVLTIGVVNFRFFVTPANDLANNRNWQVATAIGTGTPSGSIILIGGCGSDLSIHNKIYISYFAYRKTFILDWMLGKGMSLEDIRSHIREERSRGTPVYLFSEILRDSPTLKQLLENHNLKATDYFGFVKHLASDPEESNKKNIILPDGFFLVPVD